MRRIAQRAEMRTLAHPDATVRARGKALPGDPNFLDPERLARTGRWEYWYPNGVKRAEIAYALICFHYCGTIPSTMTSDHEVGPFTIWYPSGRKLGQGTFQIVRRRVVNNCTGGAETDDGQMVDTKWWREDGTEMTLADARLTGLLLPGW
jgi:hypothetical protein